jgi:NADP-dependent 3-hydroxy acid dehydrogenase YdfG
VKRFGPHPARRPAIVTGASSGIGEATARALAASGHPVVLGARRIERCEHIAKEIEDDGGTAFAVPLDLADEGSIKEFAAAAEKALGVVEVLISNAGESIQGTALETDAAEFARLIDVNLLGAQRLVNLIAPAMVGRRRGDIVFVTSDSVRSPWPGVAAYVSSKWGLEGLARAMQLELEGTGVRTSIVRPGPTLTEMGSRWDPARLPRMVDEFKRWGVLRHQNLLKPEDVARVVVDIVSMPRGAHITSIDLQPEAPPDEGSPQA